MAVFFIQQKNPATEHQKLQNYLAHVPRVHRLQWQPFTSRSLGAAFPGIPGRWGGGVTCWDGQVWEGPGCVPARVRPGKGDVPEKGMSGTAASPKPGAAQSLPAQAGAVGSQASWSCVRRARAMHEQGTLGEMG